MGLLDRLFRRTASPATRLMDAIANLQIGIVTNLIIEYGSRLPQFDAVSLAGAVLSEVVMEPPTSAEIATFSRAHSTLVRTELLRLSQNAGVLGLRHNAGVADALSYLYAAKTIQLALIGSPQSEAARLLRHAIELGIYIPNMYDICGSADANQCLIAIGEFADRYREQAFGRSAVGQDRAFVETKIREWQEAVAKDPTDFDTLTAIGSAYGKLGDYATAESYFKKAIAVKPSYAEAWSGLGVTYGFLKRPVDAEKALRKALSLDPNDPVTRAKLGSTLSKLGRFDEAIPEYRKAISLKPDLADAYLSLGIAYLQKGDRREAARQVAPLRKLDKDRAMELQNLLEQFR